MNLISFLDNLLQVKKNFQDKLLGYLLNKDMKTETHVSFMGNKCYKR